MIKILWWCHLFFQEFEIAGISAGGQHGNLLGPHAVARAGQEVDYGFGEFHKL